MWICRLDSGPTKLLPFSQAYGPGYLAFTRDDFRAYFEDHCVQLPLDKGDVLLFSPALYHAAGDNRSGDIHRLANLLQVGSALGRTLEAVDRAAMCKAVYPTLLGRDPDEAGIAAAIAACAEGYPFPTNLDTDPPEGGRLVPETGAELMHRALRAGMTAKAFAAALDGKERGRRP